MGANVCSLLLGGALKGRGWPPGEGTPRGSTHGAGQLLLQGGLHCTMQSFVPGIAPLQIVVTNCQTLRQQATVASQSAEISVTTAMHASDPNHC